MGFRHPGADEIETESSGNSDSDRRSPKATYPSEQAKAPPRGRQVIPACCWLAECWEPMGRHSRSWGQRDDSTSHRPPVIPENDDEAILPGRAFRGSFPQWLSECHMWPWPMEPVPCLYGLQDRTGFLPYPSTSQSGEAEAWFWAVCTRATSDTEKPRVWRVQHPPRLGLPRDKIGIRMGICFGLWCWVNILGTPGSPSTLLTPVIHCCPGRD